MYGLSISEISNYLEFWYDWSPWNDKEMQRVIYKIWRIEKVMEVYFIVELLIA